MSKNISHSLFPLGFPCFLLPSSDLSSAACLDQGTNSTYEVKTHESTINKYSFLSPAEYVDESFIKNCYLCNDNILNESLIVMSLIKSEIPPFVRICDENTVLNFISKNKGTLVALKSSILRIKQNFDSEASIELSLFEDSDDWKTLFIEVNTKKSWEEIREFRESEWDILYKEYRDVSKIINYQFC